MSRIERTNEKHHRPSKVRVPDAAAEAEEVKKWTCKTCDTMVEADGDHCRACAQYWRDVEDGIFEDQDYGQLWSEALDEY